MVLTQWVKIRIFIFVYLFIIIMMLCVLSLQLTKEPSLTFILPGSTTRHRQDMKKL